MSDPQGAAAASSVQTDASVSAQPRVGAVVVNHDAGDVLLECIESLQAEGISEIVVVDNASSDGSVHALEGAHPSVRILETGRNLGYGAGANRGLDTLQSDVVLVCNPDVSVHRGSVAALKAVLAADRTVAIAGPRIEEPDGSRYPSARRFPSLGDAAGHALLGQWMPGNRFTRRYKMEDVEVSTSSSVDWVSGACFAVRRQAMSELGGFDEAYFMYAEDVDLCWRARRAGWRVVYVPVAVVTHLQGISTSRRPFRMLVAHHTSAFRFASRSTSGWRRVALPAVAVTLAVRLVSAVVRQAFTRHFAGGVRRAD